LLVGQESFQEQWGLSFQAGAVGLKTSATDLHTTEVFHLPLKHPSPCNETLTTLQICHSEISQILALNADLPNHSASS
jgi:hypothetical protein